MKKASLLPRLTALALALLLLLSPALALDVDQARALLKEHYVDPIDQEVLNRPTIPDILEALGDPYTEYFTPEEYEAFMDSMSDTSLGGIGVTTTWTEEGLLVNEVMADSPAQAVGIQAGDVLVEADGVSLRGMEQNEATQLIRGPEGTRVRITYLRQGRSRTVTLTRATIVVPATTGRLLEGGVGYIDCDTWGEETLGHFRQLIGEMDGQAGCWLIDLRGNTGGLTTAATDTAGLFCGAELMLSLRYRSEDADSPDGYVYQFFEPTDPALTDKPAVVLVDGHTASASEAFAAALRDYGRAVIVGERTFGKGIAQGLWDKETHPDIFPDGDCLKITVARFYSPLSNTNDVMGVIPHFLIEDADEAEESALLLAQRLARAGADWPEELEGLLSIWQGEEFRFSDTAESPYEPSISALAAAGLVAGEGDGLFHPEDTLTRAQLAQLLQNVLDIQAGTTAAYTDVPAGAWYAQAVAVVDEMGLMEGTGLGLFSPDRELTRQELFTVLGRLGRWLNDDLDLEVRRGGEEQWDIRVLEGYADWAKAPVWLLSCVLEGGDGQLANLLWDDPELIDPTAPATRAEAAEVLYTLFYYLSVLP